MADAKVNGKEHALGDDDATSQPQKTATRTDESNEEPKQSFGDRIEALWVKSELSIPVLLTMAKYDLVLFSCEEGESLTEHQGRSPSGHCFCHVRSI